MSLSLPEEPEWMGEFLALPPVELWMHENPKRLYYRRRYIDVWAGGHLRGCPRAIPDLCASVQPGGTVFECACDEIVKEDWR